MMSHAYQASDYQWIPIAEITTPKNNHLTYVDYYWVANDHDEVALFGTTPQANLNPKIVERICQRRPGTHMRHIPVAYLPWRLSDYV